MMIMMMKIFLTKKQKNLVNNDIKTILNRCDKIARKMRDDLKNEAKSHDENCPRCKERVSAVNKIFYVNEFYIVESFFFMKIKNDVKTKIINHCSLCGNEWEKFKIKDVSQFDVLKLSFKYLSEIISNPEKRIDEWKLENIEVFDNCSAEAIYLLYKQEKKNLSLKKYKINLSDLRKKYSSIFRCKN